MVGAAPGAPESHRRDAETENPGEGQGAESPRLVKERAARGERIREQGDDPGTAQLSRARRRAGGVRRPTGCRAVWASRVRRAMSRSGRAGSSRRGMSRRPVHHAAIPGRGRRQTRPRSNPRIIVARRPVAQAIWPVWTAGIRLGGNDAAHHGAGVFTAPRSLAQHGRRETRWLGAGAAVRSLCGTSYLQEESL